MTVFDGGNSAIEGGTDGGTANFQSGSTVSGFDEIPADWASEGICDPLEDKPGIIWQDLTNVVGESPGELMGDPQQEEDAGLTTPDLLDFGGLDFDSLAADYPALPMAQARECGLVPATHRAEGLAWTSAASLRAAHLRGGEAGPESDAG